MADEKTYRIKLTPDDFRGGPNSSGRRLLAILKEEGATDVSRSDPYTDPNGMVEVQFDATPEQLARIRTRFKLPSPGKPGAAADGSSDRGANVGDAPPPGAQGGSGNASEDFYWRAYNATQGVADNGISYSVSRVQGSNFNLVTDGSRSFLQFTQAGSRGQETGWKFHLSVNSNDVPRATQIVREVYEQYGLGTFKVTRPDVSLEFNNPANGQAGKMFTLYDQGEGSERWRAAIQTIEQRFRAAGIQAGPPVAGDRAVAGSRYAQYRNDGGSANYVSAREAASLPPEQRYNPTGASDPYKNMSVGQSGPAPGAQAGADPQATPGASRGAFTQEELLSAHPGADEAGHTEVRIRVGSRDTAIARQQALARDGITTNRVRIEGDPNYYVTMSVDDWNARIVGAHPASSAASPAAAGSGDQDALLVEARKRLQAAGIDPNTASIVDGHLRVTLPQEGSRVPVADALRVPMSEGNRWIVDRISVKGQNTAVVAIEDLQTAFRGGWGMMTQATEIMSGAGRLFEGFKKFAGTAAKWGGRASLGVMVYTIGTTLAHAAAPGDAQTAENDLKSLANMATGNPVGAVAAFATAAISEPIKQLARLAGVQTGPTLGETFAALTQKIGAERASVSVATAPLASAAGSLLSNLAPVIGSAEFKGTQGLLQAAKTFRGEYNSVASGNTAALTEQSANFADKLAERLRDKGPAGDAVRKAMADYLNKMGVTSEQYAQFLTDYAEALRTGGAPTSPDPSASTQQATVPPSTQQTSDATPRQRTGSRPQAFASGIVPPLASPTAPQPASATAASVAPPPVSRQAAAVPT